MDAIQELKAAAYDLLAQAEAHQLEILRLKEELSKINEQIKKLSNENLPLNT